MNYFIGIVTKDRYEGLDVLLKSLRQPTSVPILIIDVSTCFRKASVITDVYPNVTVYQNTIEDYKTVVHNKNIILHNFLKTSYDYLFLIEDDVKVLDVDVFEKYIETSEKYNIPHMNFGNPSDKMSYTVDDLQINEKLQGVFGFYTKQCIKTVGLMNPLLCHNCWEHVEYTARIHQVYNYSPVFFHFPDIIDSCEYLKLQKLKSTINSNEYVDTDKRLMCSLLNWKNFPEISIKRFNSKTIKNL